ncbi:MAG TPA: TIGR03067 domain-containing protein [Gemmataceae bacterium]|nr:TIGR03067 domain-containing protein [Gemmataceae bacterium]
MTALLLTIALAVAAPAPKDKKPDPGPIEGEWVIQSYVLGSKEDDSEKGEKVRISDGVLVVGESEKARYALDSKPDLSRIDLTLVEGKQPKILGIYKIDGDTLVLCFPKGGGADRPAKFESPAGTRIVLMTLKRKKQD